MTISYCAPHVVRDRTNRVGCLPREKLYELVEKWNEEHPAEKIIGNIRKMPSTKLWDLINQKMRRECGDGVEWCWVKKLRVPGANEYYRPEKPLDWLNDKDVWLSNFDIDKVMKQYEKVPGLMYKFLGVFPIDFASKNHFGQCLYQAMCSDMVKPLYEKGIRFMGAIFNLDRHDQGGSHWVSMIACLDKEHPLFGVNFYDSVGRAPPKEIVDFMKNLQKQWAGVDKSVNLPLRRNQKRHQYGNNECGMFSMMVQIIVLENLIKGSRLSYEELLALPLNDDVMNKMRDILYRPPTAVQGGGRQIQIMPV